MTVAEAAGVVSEMAGRYRLPDAFKLADRLARGLEPADDAVFAGSRTDTTAGNRHRPAPGRDLHHHPSH
jgi:hypothetical protein